MIIDLTIAFLYFKTGAFCFGVVVGDRKHCFLLFLQKAKKLVYGYGWLSWLFRSNIHSYLNIFVNNKNISYKNSL
jgi:hypothetical protein